MSRKLIFAASASLSAIAVLSPWAQAQYRDYPQTAGKTESLPLKALPAWTSFDLEVRQRSEGQTALNDVSGNGNGYDLSRVRGGFRIAPAKWLSTYVQFQDAGAHNLAPSMVASNMRDTFDFRQAYLKLQAPHAEVVAGRQELRFGGERLVGVSDWTNVGRTFDAVTGKFGGKNNNITLFSSSVVLIHPTALDMHAGGLNFHGAYVSLATLFPYTILQPYVFVKALPRVLSQQGTYGTETEVIPGMRVVGNLPLRLDYMVEGVLERGSFSNNSIHAGAGYAKLGYTAHMPFTPRLQAEYDYATGNPQTNPQRVGTFDQLYPSAHNVFGLVDLFGWQNIREKRLGLDINPVKNLTFLFQGEYLNTANVHDSVYNGSGSVLIKHPKAGFASDQLGSEFDLSSKYVIHGYIVLNSGVAHFFPGPVMTANAHGAAATIAYMGLTYRARAGGPGPEVR